MHGQYERACKWTEAVIGAAIEVHRHKGPGLLESIYEKCLMRELELRNIPAANQTMVEIEYKGVVLAEKMFLDVLVDGCLIVELKAVEHVLPIHKAQLMSYMRLMNVPLGLLINFHELRLVSGVHRMMLPNANIPDAS